MNPVRKSRLMIWLTTLAVSATLCTWTNTGWAAWSAGPDFTTNETSAGELTNPNSSVPEWSYGYRGTVAGSSITLFAGAVEHTNAAGGDPNLQGWASAVGPGGAPVILVNVGGAPLITSVGAGPLDPSEMLVHGGIGAFAYGVVRWTAPAAGIYSVTADWTRIHFGDIDVHLVVNGVSIFDDVPAVGSAYSNSGLLLSLGDTLDFLTGINGSFSGDSTAFNATIGLAPPQAAPEPASLGLLGLGLAGLGFSRRRRNS